MPEDELDVGQILRAPTCALVGKERSAADHRDGNIADLNLSSVVPNFFETNAVNRRNHVDSLRNDTHLVDEVVTREVLGTHLIERRTEFRQGSEYATSVLEVVRDPDVEIAGGARLRVNGQRVSADEQKPNPAVDEFV